MKTDGSDKNEKGQQRPEADPVKTLQHQIAAMAGEFERALPGKIGVDRMMRIAMTAILNNPTLAQCNPMTFFGSLLQALQLGLEVNTPLGQAYLIPRWDKKLNDNKGGYHCYFQMGYQGILDLCYRYGKYKNISAEVVYEGDDFSYRLGSNQKITHIPKNKTDKPLFVWGRYELENGGESFKVWTWDKVIKHAQDFSDSYDENKKWASPWLSKTESGESMARKTLLIAVLKYAPKTVEIAQAVNADEKMVIVKKYDEGGESRLHFDVQYPQIEAPDEKAKEFMNKVNNGVGNKGAATAATQDAETVPAQSATKAKQPTAASSLFPTDEAAALEEQYQQQMAGARPPDFD
jgi:recombination protein RecT